MLLGFISPESLVILALLAALAEVIGSSPALPKEEVFVGETLMSRSDRAVGLLRVEDMVILVKSLRFFRRSRSFVEDMVLQEEIQRQIEDLA